MSKLIFTSILVFLVSISFAQSDNVKSIRLTTDIKIDGDASDWKQLRYYDNTTKLFFDFTNDDTNLYLCFQSKDEMQERKIMRAGMTITVKIKGNSKASIKFPLQQSSDMEVKGFKTKDGIIPSNDISGINAAIKQNESRILTYEISIPLKELSSDPVKDFSKDIDMTAEVHPLNENSPGKEKNFSGRGGRNGGGREGNRREGEDRYNNPQQDDSGNSELNPERSMLFEKTEFKQKFTLAVK